MISKFASFVIFGAFTILKNLMSVFIITLKIEKQWVNQVAFFFHLNSTQLWEFKVKEGDLGV